MIYLRLFVATMIAVFVCSVYSAQGQEDEAVRVFILPGQSNMVGSDSKVQDIERFGTFVGFGAPQPDVRFSHCLGPENNTKSDSWIELPLVNNVAGPELSFAREVNK